MPAKGEARRAIRARYAAKYPERVLASAKKSRAKNRAAILARAARYRELHRAELRAKSQAYQDLNRAAVRARNAAWRAAHPEEMNAMRLAYDRAHPELRQEISQRYRARKKNATIVETIHRQAIYARDQWICHLCLHPVDPTLTFPDPRSASLDHIIPVSKDGNHSNPNLALAHLGCNAARGNRDTLPSHYRLRD